MRAIKRLLSCFYIILIFSSSISSAEPSYNRLHKLNSCIESFSNSPTDGVSSALGDFRNCNLIDDDISDLLQVMYQRNFTGQLFLSNNHITSRGALLLSQYTKSHSYNLDHNPIGNEGLMSFLKDKYLHWLFIGYNDVDDSTANKFVQSLADINIRAIHLQHFHLTRDSLLALANNSNLYDLQISESDLSEADVDILMKSNSIDTLRLDNDNLNFSSFISISQNPNLKTLSINNNNVGDDAAGLFAKSKSLTSLDVNNNHITIAGLRMLLNSSSITALYVDDNDIRDGELMLDDNNALTYLYMSDNAIGSNIMRALTEHLHELKTLTLDNNEIDSAGLSNITRLNKLDSISLRHNIIGDEGLAALANSSFLKVDLSYNNIGDLGVKAITSGSIDVDTLILSHNNITDDGAISLANPGSKYRVLTLDLGYNKLTNRGLDAIERGSYPYFSLHTEGNEG